MATPRALLNLVFRSSISVQRDSRREQAGIHSVSHQGHDHGISAVHEHELNRQCISQNDELTSRPQSSCDGEPNTLRK
jgi:hypothetical protein